MDKKENEYKLEIYDYLEDFYDGGFLPVFATGHRPTKLPGGYKNFILKGGEEIRYKVINILEDFIKKGMKLELINGAALGFDTMFGFIAISLRKKYPDKVKVVTYVPTLDHGNNWVSERDKKYFRRLVKESDEVIYSNNRNYKDAHDLQIRNEDMVNRGALGVALWDGTDGGTKNCIDYAQQMQVPIIQLNPNTLKIKRI